MTNKLEKFALGFLFGAPLILIAALLASCGTSNIPAAEGCKQITDAVIARCGTSDVQCNELTTCTDTAEWDEADTSACVSNIESVECADVDLNLVLACPIACTESD